MDRVTVQESSRGRALEDGAGRLEDAMQTLVVGCLAQLPLATGLPQAALRIAQRCRHMRVVVSGTRSECGIRLGALLRPALLCPTLLLSGFHVLVDGPYVSYS